MSNPEKVLFRIFVKKNGEIDFVLLKFLDNVADISIAFSVKDKNEVIKRIKEAIDNAITFETD